MNIFSFKRLQSLIVLKWLWISAAYPFFLAHKPLCSRFKEDVIRLGSLYLCRSCLSVYTGIAGGLAATLVFPEIMLAPVGRHLFIGLCLTVLPLSYPPWYKKWPRLLRDGLRFMLGLAIISGILRVFQGDFLPALIGFGVSLLLWKIYSQKRRRQKLHACNNCPDSGGICPGFKFQANLIRQYEQRATDFLSESGYVPEKVKELRIRN
ncbi:MAG: hypothetical protein GY862_37220 [Gammaproteobacteria bacterium]|nr:hypothetical protein [Gammaproteobacteria bacterium]